MMFGGSCESNTGILPVYKQQNQLQAGCLYYLKVAPKIFVSFALFVVKYSLAIR